MNDVLSEFEETAMLGCKVMREHMNYRGNLKEYRDRARTGSVAVAAYTRLRGTLANERQLAILEGRYVVAGATVHGLASGSQT